MCCGMKRPLPRTDATLPAHIRQPQWQPVAQLAPRPAAAPPTPLAQQQAPSVLFEYVGRTGLTVVSPATGKRYRFDSTGSQVAVDPRDKSMLLQVPNLRPIRFRRDS
jgi:hypothetical protein